MLFAVETLAAYDVVLKGDLIVATNTDEESSGAGGLALVARGLRADAAIVTEPTTFEVWTACRGSEYGVIHVPGRPGHADLHQGEWRDGGAVNAIEKAIVVLEAIQSLRARWATRDGLAHPILSRPSILPTMAHSGEWRVTYPASCAITFGAMYLPAQADEAGWGSDVQREIETWILGETAARDDWLAAHPPVIEWRPTACMPYEIDAEEPVAGAMLRAAADAGLVTGLGGLDSWFDGATLTRFGDIPTIAFGPPGIQRNGVNVAHTIDEYVPVDGLVASAQALAVAAMRFCGIDA
jgi:acetylornithine deacetylase